MVVSHNTTAMNAERMFGQVSLDNANVSEKLSSGYRINRSKDDAAGLSISEKMRWQVRGLNRASYNAQDGISYIQTTEGALNEVHSLLQRGRELSVQAANDSNTVEDRQAIQEEINQLVKEVNRIAKTTEYNTLKVFDSSNASANIRTAADGRNVVLRDGDYMTFDAMQDFSGAIAQAAAAGKTFTQAGLEGFATALKNTYLPKLLSGIVGALNDSSVPTVSNMKIGLQMYYENNSTLAYVSSNGAKFQLGVNLKFLTESAQGINMTDDLATTIAHEMTHAVMFDTVTNGMLGSSGGDSFPLWFVEGVAQSVGGAMNYVVDLQNMVNSNASDEAIKKWLSKLTNTSNAYNAYSAGYIASMYLGYVAGGEGTLNASTIADGLDKLLKDVGDGYSLSQAIARHTNGKYESLTDFEDKFANDAIGFARDLVRAAGSGTGSIISPQGLSGTKASLLTTRGTNNYFVLDVDNQWVDNSNEMQQAGKNPWSGGGATTTNGSDRNGNTNPDAQNKWIDAGSRNKGFAAGTRMLQVGAQKGQSVEIASFNLSDKDLEINNLDVTSYDKAGDAIGKFDTAIEKVSSMRSYYGALQNRLEHTIANLDNISENVQTAESRIRDADMASLMVEYSKNNILQQAGQAMISQANSSQEAVLALLG